MYEQDAADRLAYVLRRPDLIMAANIWAETNGGYAGMALEEFLEKIGYDHNDEQVAILREWLDV